MSFDICFHTFDHEESFRFPRSELLARFKGHIASEDKHREYRLTFDEGPTLAELCFDKETMIDGFVVRRPPDYLEFWNIVAGIVRDFPCLLYWPGTLPASVIGSLDMLPHLPKYFVENMGIPWVSTDPERIRQYVWDNS